MFKFCQKCGVLIATPEDDVYRAMAIKYCPECRAISDREHSAKRQKAFRRRTKEKYKAQETRCSLLAAENAALRERLERERELADRIESLERRLAKAQERAEQLQ